MIAAKKIITICKQKEQCITIRYLKAKIRFYKVNIIKNSKKIKKRKKILRTEFQIRFQSFAKNHNEIPQKNPKKKISQKEKQNLSQKNQNQTTRVIIVPTKISTLKTNQLYTMISAVYYKNTKK